MVKVSGGSCFRPTAFKIILPDFDPEFDGKAVEGVEDELRQYGAFAIHCDVVASLSSN